MTDTIAAIATATGEAGIAIVRLSGSRSIEIADAVFRGHGPPPSGRLGGSFAHGFIRADLGAGATDLDEVILLVYRAPHSYTREDVIEIQGHGGRTCAKRILRAVLAAGARMAEPGEFTRRAFLNGRIDLLQAEAILDLVRAVSDRAASAAIEQLDGHLSHAFSALYDDLLEIAGNLEVSLDFPEEDVPASLHSGMKERLLLLAERMRQWLATWDEGHLLREGALVVIGGCPNVGKSTLLNCLVGKERAIVTAVPGTTRDTIEEHMVLGGVPLRLVDTAGIREAQGEVERKGVERAKAAMNRADLILYVMDGSRPLSDDDIPRLTELAPKKCVVVLNKADIGVAVRAQDVPGFDVASCSLLKREGLGRIVELISTKMGIDTEAPPHAVIAERHRVELEQATREMVDAIEALSSNREDWVPLVASNVRRAMGCIGRVTGRTHSDDILDSVFGRFCIGK